MGYTSTKAANLADLYHETRVDIFAFAREFNFHPTSQQAEVMMDFHNATYDFGKRKVAVKSGQGTGKTKVSTIGGLWRAWRNEDAKTFVTAPTMRQCRQVWLAEAAKGIEGANSWIRDRMRATGSRVIIGNRPEQWGVSFFTATKAENAQGLHNLYMTLICEEASGIPRPLIEQIDGTIKNDDYLWLQIGNPNSRLSAFFDCFNSDLARWQIRTLRATESPLTSKKSIDEQILKYGAESDFVKVRIHGDFPDIDPDCVFGIDELTACTKTSMLEMTQVRDDGLRLARQFGIDLARFGGDESVIFARLGHAVFLWKFYSKLDPNTVVEKAVEFQMQLKWSNEDTRFVADATGLGQGVMRRFYDMKKKVTEFHNHGTSTREEYDNAITEAYFHLRDLVRSRKCHLPNDSILFQQLTTRRYYMTKDGKIILESKDDYMKRGFDSPDRADALAMCFYDGAVVRSRIIRPNDGAARRLGVVTRAA